MESTLAVKESTYSTELTFLLEGGALSVCHLLKFYHIFLRIALASVTVLVIKAPPAAEFSILLDM
jgi:hypothetical protein